VRDDGDRSFGKVQHTVRYPADGEAEAAVLTVRADDDQAGPRRGVDQRLLRDGQADSRDHLDAGVDLP
jgi:hypothetical protein